jgi:hypothetical protein
MERRKEASATDRTLMSQLPSSPLSGSHRVELELNDWRVTSTGRCFLQRPTGLDASQPEASSPHILASMFRWDDWVSRIPESEGSAWLAL